MLKLLDMLTRGCAFLLYAGIALTLAYVATAFGQAATRYIGQPYYIGIGSMLLFSFASLFSAYAALYFLLRR
jgi:hypothetical protein